MPRHTESNYSRKRVENQPVSKPQDPESDTFFVCA